MTLRSGPKPADQAYVPRFPLPPQPSNSPDIYCRLEMSGPNNASSLGEVSGETLQFLRRLLYLQTKPTATPPPPPKPFLFKEGAHCNI